MSARTFRYICLILGLAGLVLTIRSYTVFAAERAVTESRHLKDSQKEVLDKAIQINNSVSQIVDMTRNVAKDLSTEKLKPADIEQRLRKEAREIFALHAIGIAYEPGALEPEMERYARYYVREEQGSPFQMISFDYDYANPPKGQEAWYVRVSELKGTWSEPVNDIEYGNLQVVYALPFTRWDKTQLKNVPAGVVFAALSLDYLQQLVKDLELGDEGYAYIISGTGNYLAHPNLNQTKSIESENDKGNTVNNASDSDLNTLNLKNGDSRIFSGESKSFALPTNTISFNAKAVKSTPDYNAAELKSYVENAAKGTSIFYNGTLGNRPVWYFFEPIPAAGWSIGIVLQKDPHNEMVSHQKTAWVKMGLMLILALTLIAVFVFKSRFESHRSVWAVSATATTCMLGVITLIWILEITSPSTLNFSNILSSHGVLTQTLKDVDQAFLREGSEPPAQIPTGIFIESFSIDGRNITFTGYVWQKFPATRIDEAEDPPFVIFLDSQSQEQELAYKFTEGDAVVIGHYFRVIQMQTFASDKYPLDLATVSLQLQTTNLDQKYLLVPDLDSYIATNPSSIPGIRTNLNLNNWNLVGSAFTYNTEPRNMDFGSKKSIKQYNLPTLQFDISMKRYIVPSLLSYGITAIVTAILMFTLVVSKAENLRSVLTESFALFFILVVAHVGLRSELASQGIVYLETLFIMLYVLILLGVLNGLLQFVEFKMPLLSYKDGLLFKLSYWPFLFGGFLLVSLAKFYPEIFK